MSNNLSRRGFLGSLAAVGAAGVVSVPALAQTVKAPAKWDKTVDFLIVGTGFAGLGAAIEAHEQGIKNILVIDKMPSYGGNSIINGGILTATGCPQQLKHGIKDSPELLASDMLAAGLYMNQPEKVKLVAKSALSNYEWTVKELGVEYNLEAIGQEGGHSVPRYVFTKNGSGSGIVTKELEKLKKMGVPVRLRCYVERIFRDDSGRVVGVQIREGYRFPKADSGKVKTIGVKKGLVLCYGGFSRDVDYRMMQDPKLVAKLDSTNQPGATAGVLIKALGIGAAPVQLCWLQFLPYCNPNEKGFGVSVNFTNHACMDLGLVVDRKTGKRFMDEHAGRKIKADAMFKVIGNDKNYPIAVCDDAIVKAINPSFVRLPLEMGTVKKFDTLEALAKHFGIKQDAFLAEVKKFNNFVKEGTDKDFHRILKFNKGLDVSKPPFYGIEVCPKIHHTMGGVMINNNAQVISATTHAPIKGLYAGGEVTGGVHGASRLGTVAVIDALTFGMIAGEQFAKMKA